MQKKKVNVKNLSKGMERKQVLESGGIWVKPPMVMEMKTKYNRKKQKIYDKKDMQEM